MNDFEIPADVLKQWTKEGEALIAAEQARSERPSEDELPLFIPSLPPINHVPIPRSTRPFRWSDAFAFVTVLLFAAGGFTMFVWLIFGSHPRGGMDRRETEADRMSKLSQQIANDAASQPPAAKPPRPMKEYDKQHYIETGQVRPPQSPPYVRPGDLHGLPRTPKPEGKWYDRYLNK